MKVDIDVFEELFAADLLWHAENCPTGDELLTDSLLRVAFYYMTFEQVAQYLGSKTEAEEYFK